MGRALRDESGGIKDLLTLPPERAAALEADLLTAGFTLGDVPGRVTWRALYALYVYARPGSAVHETARRETLGVAAAWQPEAHLLADLVNEVRQLIWLTQAVNRGHNKDGVPNPLPPRPTLIRRPGDTLTDDGDTPNGEGTSHIGFDPIPMDDFEQWWATGEESAA